MVVINTYTVVKLLLCFYATCQLLMFMVLIHLFIHNNNALLPHETLISVWWFRKKFINRFMLILTFIFFFPALLGFELVGCGLCFMEVFR